MEVTTKGFETVKNYLLDMEYNIKYEDETEGIVVIEKQDEGILNLVLDCEDSILVMEQSLFEVKHESPELYKELLIKNRDIVHGAFALDNGNVLFRDTLQLENLDKNELEGSINSLSLLMTEYADKLIEFSK